MRQNARVISCQYDVIVTWQEFAVGSRVEEGDAENISKSFHVCQQDTQGSCALMKIRLKEMLKTKNGEDEKTF